MSSGQDKDNADKEKQPMEFKIHKKVPKQVVEGASSAEFEESYEDIQGAIDPNKLSKFSNQDTSNTKEGSEHRNTGDEPQK